MTHHLGLLDRADGELVAAARAGDERAFDSLYRRHARRVAGVCRRRVPAAEVDDVVQEAFARAFDRLGTLDDGARFGPWVRTIAVRACADAGRRRGPVVASELCGEIDPTRLDPDEIVIDRAEARQVADGMARLGDRDRRALWLRDALGAPVSEVAADMGTTEGATRVMLTRARKRLRAAVVAVLGWIAGARLAGRQRAAALGDLVPASVSLTTAQVAVAVTAAFVAPSLPTAPARPAAGIAPASVAAPRPTPAEVAVAPTPDPRPAADGQNAASAPPAPDDVAGEPLVEVGPRPAGEGPDPDVAIAVEDDTGERADLGVFVGNVVEAVIGDDAAEPNDDTTEPEEPAAGDALPERCLLACG